MFICGWPCSDTTRQWLHLMILHVARAKDICYQTYGVNSILELIFFNGIDQFGIELCYKKLNPQINLPFNFLIQKYSFHHNPTWNINGIDKFDAELIKWNWVGLELTKWIWPHDCLLHWSINPSYNFHIILNNSYIWLVSWENSQTGTLSQDPLRTLWFGLLVIDVSNGLIHLYTCESLLWLLNKINQIISELEQNVRETNIQ